MDRYEVLLSPQASRDLDGIHLYIGRVIQEPEIAKKQADRLWDGILALSHYPYAHQERLIGQFACKGYRQLLIDRFIVLFRIDEEKKKVLVVTVQFQGRNI